MFWDNSALDQSNYALALAGKAEALGDESILSAEIDALLVRPAMRNDIDFAGKIAEQYKANHDKIQAFDKILDFHKEETSPNLTRALNRLRNHWLRELGGETLSHLRRARSAQSTSKEGEEFSEFWKKYRTKQAEQEQLMLTLDASIDSAADSVEKVRLIDVFLTEHSQDISPLEIYELLFRKADLLNDKAEKTRVYEEIIDKSLQVQMGSFPSSPNWSMIQKAYQGMAAQLDGNEEKRRLFDSAIERHSDSVYKDVTELVIPLRLERIKLLKPGPERIKELKAIALLALKSDGFRNAGWMQTALKQTLSESAPADDTIGEEIFAFLEPFGGKMDWIASELDRIDALPDQMERAAAYGSIAKRYLTNPDPRVSWLARRLQIQTNPILGDLNSRLTFIDKQAKASVDRIEKAQTLLLKVDILSDSAAKSAVYDEVLALLTNPQSPGERRERHKALLGKAELIDDPAARADAYAAILLELSRESDAFSRLLEKTVGEKLDALEVKVR